MRKLFNALMLVLIAFTCASCHKELDVKDPVVSNDEMAVSGAQARFSWCVEFSGAFQTGVELSPNANMTELRRVEAKKEGDKYVAVVDGLLMGTKYYYRIVVWNKLNNYVQEMKSFSTSTAYTVTLSCNPEAGGTATGGGTFAEGDTCTVVATTNAGYNFVNWTENGSQVSTDSVFAFAVTGNRDLLANFREEDTVLYTVITKAEPVEGGIVTGGGNYLEGREIELKATANTGYTFIHWDDGSTDNPRRVTVTADVTYTAHFNHDEYEIKVECQPENGGTATGGGMFHYGDTIALSATPNVNFNFEGWSDGSTDNLYEVVVTGNATFKAIFSEAGAVYYNVATHVYPGDYAGTVTGGGPHPEGSQIQLSANANTEAGYLFEKWDDGNIDNPRTITVNSNMEFTAYFKKKTYTVTVQVSTGGTAHIGDMTGTIEATFEHGESCTVHALPETGYSFVNWTENGIEASTDEIYSFNVTSNHNLVANFQQQQYWIGTSVEPTGSGSVSGGNLYYNHGEQCNLTATANEQYEFDHWTKNGSSYPGESTITFTVTEAASYTAHFRLKQYTVTVSASTGGSAHVGSPTGPTTVTYTSGQQCTVYAVANSNYIFSNWTEGGNAVSSQANYTFTVNGNRSLMANFTYNGGGSAPEGAINGKFTINDNDDQVYFSKGNLQYIGSANTPYWKFADNQWDALGNNDQGSTNQNVDRDLFGWGTSGWSGSGATYYRPWDTDNSNGSLYGPPGQYNLTGTYAQADWGVYNPIYQAGNTAGQWRTLTNTEWSFVFNGRQGICYAKAQITGTSKGTVNGVILFPDDWNTSIYNPINYNHSGAYFHSNIIPASQWSTLEQAGAVFLPAAGNRDGLSLVNMNSSGYYWSASSSSYGQNQAASIYFYNSGMYSSMTLGREIGRSVRLVRSAQ